MPLPRALLTRPAPEAARWAQALAAQGVAAEALPLIAIAPPLDAAPLHAAWRALGDYAALMFVSGNAVRGFFDAEMPSGHAPSALQAIETRAWAPGPGTSAALRAGGWPAGRIDEPAPDAPQFDSEALWARVQAQAQPGRRVLIVRGAGATGRDQGREWLRARLAAAGVAVTSLAAYRRTAPVLSAAQQARARQAAHDGTVWVFSSAEAIAHLRQAVPGADWSGARALVTHPRMAEAARGAGFGQVSCTRPTLAAVAASIKSAAP